MYSSCSNRFDRPFSLNWFWTLQYQIEMGKNLQNLVATCRTLQKLAKPSRTLQNLAKPCKNLMILQKPAVTVKHHKTATSNYKKTH